MNYIFLQKPFGSLFGVFMEIINGTIEAFGVSGLGVETDEI
jgi:hypothetical protein